MPHLLRIGSAIEPTDPFWIQVREATYERAQQLGLDLISISLMDYPSTPSEEEEATLLEELQALELDALIARSLPEELTSRLLQIGLPLILLRETEARHPLLVSSSGLYDVVRLGAGYLARRLAGRGSVLAIEAPLPVGWQGGGEGSTIEGLDPFGGYPHIIARRITGPGTYEQAYPEVYEVMQRSDRPIDAILGLSDTLALAGRDAGRRLGLVGRRTPIVGIGGTPEALAAIADGSMTATVDVRTDALGRQAVDLAYQAAQGQALPSHFGYQSRLVTGRNVAEVAAQKLVAIASLSSRTVEARRRQQQERLTQLETSLEISRRVGSILDYRQLSHEIANLIRANYGYHQVQILHWVEQEQVLVLDHSDQAQAGQTAIPLSKAGVLGQALRRNEPIFIPDTHQSARFPPDPDWPATRTRVILPIRLGDRILGLLDLHCHRSSLRTRQELVGLQSLADQLGIAMSNAQLYGEAVEARTSAEKADQIKTRLLANVSHELRTPLTTILGFTRPILDSADLYGMALPPELLDDLRHVYGNAEHLLRVINDLLDLSRAEIDELDLHPEIIEPRTFLEDVFRSVADSAASGDVAWHLQLPDRMPVIQADAVRLRQIMLNLLSNAQRFTERGRVALGADVVPPHLHVWVADTGIGIPPDQQERIFEPFVTAAHTDRRPPGIGLGLSITRRLVALHRGSLMLDSQQGRGSTFHLYLPLPSLDGKPASSFAATGSRALLLISAHEELPPEVTAFSRKQGLQIRRLQAGESIEAILGAVRPVALAWDLTGATPGDWTIVQRLRRDPQMCQIPFVLYAHRDRGQTGQGLGLTNLIAKPVRMETLLEAIASLCPQVRRGPLLIVDDDARVRELYRSMVAKGLPGYPVRTAPDGADAVALMGEEPPCLVILDLLMPGMDGFEVLDWMRADDRTRRVPVLVLTGRMLTLDDIKRLERHALVTVQSKGVLSEEETTAALQRLLLGTDILPPHTSALVKRAVAYLHQNHTQPLSRREIAQAIGVSENHLSRLFRRELGLSPCGYLNRYRVERARELLMHTDDSITSVALQVGFGDPAYFSRVFRVQVGLSPRVFRERGR